MLLHSSTESTRSLNPSEFRSRFRWYHGNRLWKGFDLWHEARFRCSRGVNLCGGWVSNFFIKYVTESKIMMMVMMMMMMVVVVVMMMTMMVMMMMIDEWRCCWLRHHRHRTISNSSAIVCKRSPMDVYPASLPLEIPVRVKIDWAEVANEKVSFVVRGDPVVFDLNPQSIRKSWVQRHLKDNFINYFLF